MLIVREQVPGKVSLSPKYRAVTISSSCNFHFIYSDVLRRSPSVAQVILKTMQSWLASDSANPSTPASFLVYLREYTALLGFLLLFVCLLA